MTMTADELRRRRKALGWSRDDLAGRLMRVSARAIRSYEQEERGIPDHKAEMIDRVLANAERNLQESGGGRTGPRYLRIPEPGRESTIRRVKARMDERGITPYEIEEQLGDGFAVGTIYSWLRGETEPKASKWFKFCFHLGLAEESSSLHNGRDDDASFTHVSEDAMALPLDHDTDRNRAIVDRRFVLEAHGQRANDLRIRRNPSHTIDGRIDENTPMETIPCSIADVRGQGYYEISYEGGGHSFVAIVRRVTSGAFDVTILSPERVEETVVREDGQWKIEETGREIDFEVLARVVGYPQRSMTAS